MYTYDDLQNGLSDLAQEIESLSDIQYNHEMIEIEYYLTGDWKFLALVTGIQAANAPNKTDIEWASNGDTRS